MSASIENSILQSESNQGKSNIEEESKETIYLVFKKFDKDNSGYIQYDEICNLAQELGIPVNKDEVIQIFKELDENGDKKISFEEFWIWWTSGKPSKMEKLVYYKLKAMKILKKAHSEFTRAGLSIDKFENSIDTHYFALNYGTSKGLSKVDLEILLKSTKKYWLFQQVKEEILKGSKLNSETFFGIVIRMKSNNPKEVKKELQKLFIDAKRVIGLLFGPQMGKLIEPLEFEFLELANEVLMILNIKKSIFMKNFNAGDIFNFFEIAGQNTNAIIEMHLGIKNSLQKSISNPSLSFIDWLFEGFLFEIKVQMNRDILKLLSQFFMLVMNIEKPTAKDQWISLLSLLKSSKVHLQFKDMDNLKVFLEGLGLTELNNQAPTSLNLFNELLQNLKLNDLIDENTPYPLLRNILLFLSKSIDGSKVNISLILDSFILKADFSLPGLGDLVQQLIIK